MKRITDILYGMVGILLSLNLNAQTCISAIPAATPSSDFSVHNDGTVTHKKTNLMWKVCAEGQSWNAGACTGTPSTFTWDNALQNAQTLNVSGGYASHTDWRLPNRKELLSIVEFKCYNPVINEEVFPDMVIETTFPYSILPTFWTSSPISMSGSPFSMTMSVYFSSGNGDSTRADYHSGQLRLVRDAP